jgi:hypothetical protein
MNEFYVQVVYKIMQELFVLYSYMLETCSLVLFVLHNWE